MVHRSRDAWVAPLNRGLLARIESWTATADKLLIVAVVAFTLVSLAALVTALADPFGRTAAIADARIREALRLQCQLNRESVEQLNIREGWFHQSTRLAAVLADTGVAQTPAGLAARGRLARRLEAIDRLVLPLPEPDCEDVLEER